MLPILLLGCTKQAAPAPAAAGEVRPIAECVPPNGCFADPAEPFFAPGPTDLRVEVALFFDEHGCEPTFVAGHRIDAEARTVTLWGEPTAATLAQSGLCRALATGGGEVALTLPAAGGWTFACVDTAAECRFVKIFAASR